MSQLQYSVRGASFLFSECWGYGRASSRPPAGSFSSLDYIEGDVYRFNGINS